MSLTPEQRAKVDQLLTALGFLPDPSDRAHAVAGAGADVTHPQATTSAPEFIVAPAAMEIADAQFQLKMERRT